MAKKVLIEEDEGIIAMLNKRIVEKMGLQVCASVTSGADAIKTQASLEPDLILMDILLDDDISGIEAMQEIRKTSNTPVIFISANSDRSTYEKAISISNSSFLNKPVDIDSLKEKISAVLEL